MMISVFASFAAEPEAEPRIYIIVDGTQIEYYMDENEKAYVYKNGQKFYALLCIDEYKVENATMLMQMHYTSRYNQFNLVKSTANGNVLTTLFDGKISVLNPNIYYTNFLSFPSNASYIHVKTSSCRPLLSNHNVNIIFNWYNAGDGQMYSCAYFDYDCTSDQNFLLSGRAVNSAQVGICPLGGMTSCNLLVRSETIF